MITSCQVQDDVGGKAQQDSNDKETQANLRVDDHWYLCHVAKILSEADWCSLLFAWFHQLMQTGIDLKTQQSLLWILTLI